MRGWAAALFVVLAGLTVYLVFGTDPDPVDLVDDDPSPGNERPEEQPGEAPTRTGIEGEEGTATRDPSREKQKAFVVVVTIQAHRLEHDGSSGARIDGFDYTIVDGKGQQVRAGRDAPNNLQIELGIGDYVLTGSRADHVAPGAAKFSITKESIPFTLKLPFRKAEGILEVEVLDKMTKARLAEGAFRLTIERFVQHPARSREPDVKTEHVPKPEQNPFQVFAKYGETARVRIEARGYEPAKPIEVTLDPQNAKVVKKVFLQKAAQKTGVTFDVVDVNSTPIRHLLVIAEHKDPTGKFAPLWRRRTESADGKYALPKLAPGHYRLELRSVDKDGLPTLHLPHKYSFWFTGGEHIHEPVALKEAGAIVLELSDPNGQRIGKGVTVRLTHPDGKEHESVWVPMVDGKMDPRKARSADHLVLDAPARIDPPLPVGQYTIKLSWGDGPTVERSVFVRASETTTVRATLTK